MSPLDGATRRKPVYLIAVVRLRSSHTRYYEWDGETLWAIRDDGSRHASQVHDPKALVQHMLSKSHQTFLLSDRPPP